MTASYEEMLAAHDGIDAANLPEGTKIIYPEYVRDLVLEQYCAAFARKIDHDIMSWTFHPLGSDSDPK